VKLKQELLEAQARVSKECDRDVLHNDFVEIKSMNDKLLVDLNASLESNKILELKVANLQVELDKTKATFVRMNAGSKKLDEILGAQRQASDRSGLGFHEASSSKQLGGKMHEPKAKEVFLKSHTSSFSCKNNGVTPRIMNAKFIPICHHCGVKGHIRPHCYQLIGYPHAHSNFYDKKFWGRTHKHMPTRKTNVIHQSKSFPKAKEKVEKVRIRTLWVRSSDVRPQMNHTCVSLDDIGSFGEVDLAF
jgi:hypothetical protein